VILRFQRRCDDRILPARAVWRNSRSVSDSQLGRKCNRRVSLTRSITSVDGTDLGAAQTPG